MMWQFWRQRLADLFDRTRLRRRRSKQKYTLARFERLETRQVLSANSISILPASMAEGNSGTSLLNFVATRTGDLSSVVTVGYQTSDGTATSPSDYTAKSGEFTFGAGQSSAAISISINGDTTGEDNETLQVTLTNVVSTTGPGASFGTVGSFTANLNTKGVIFADLNGDGRPEAIAANYGSNNFSVFRNTTTAGSATANFASKQDFTTQASPIAVATGDVNGDGRPDVIVANYGTANVSVFLNTTTPGGPTFTFASPLEFSTGTQPRALTMADVNQDGKQDIAVAAFGANAVAVLLNTSSAGATSPSFFTAQSFATPANPIALANADLNGDGKPDLVVANGGADNVSVFLNNTTIGNATVQFQTRQDFATGVLPSGVALGDLNGDGRADIAVSSFGSGSVSVLLNQTNTGATSVSFPASESFAAGNGPRAIALSDTNGDGTLDVIVANGTDNTVATLVNRTARGAGTMTLAAPTTVTVSTQPYSLAVGDLNGDGKPDVATASLSSGDLSAAINTTTWDSTPPTLVGATLTASTTTHGLANGDLNGDGKPELIAAVPGANGLGIFVNASTPGAATASFATRQDVALSAAPVTVNLADINLDGRPDLIVTMAPNVVTILLNTTPAGSSTISFAASPTSFALGSVTFETAIADLNGDGRPDIVVSTPTTNNITFLTNNTTPGASTSAFTTTSLSATLNPYGVVLADINGDGRRDLITVNQGTGTAVGSGTTASVRLNTTTAGAATPSFGTRVDFAVGAGPRSIAALDVNGDGKLDLVTANRVGNNVSVLINGITTGSSSLTSSSFTRTDFTAGSEPYAIRTADLNGDGRGDLIIGNRSSANVSVLFNTTTLGSATPAFGSSTTAGTVGSRYLTVGDFNLDGRTDFASADPSGSNVTLQVTRPSVFAANQAVGTITNDDAPAVVSIARNVPSNAATNATNVSYIVTFSHAVTGVDSSDFVTTGDVLANITSVTGSGTSWTVAIDAASQGTLNLQLIDDDTIRDVTNLPLAETGLGNGNFTNPAAAYTIDVTPPTLTPNVSPSPNGFGWNNTDVNVTFDAQDNLSGVNAATLQGNTTLTQEGTLPGVTGQVSDNAGNHSSLTTSTIRIDKTAPTLQGTPNILPNANGWYRTDVTYTFTADDPLSGVPVAPSPFTVTGEGSNLSAVGSATDRAGNTGTLTVSNIKIDRTLPTITRVTSTTANGTYGPGATINLTIEFSEAVTLLSGTLILDLNNGAQVTLLPGSFTNATQAVATYTVANGQAVADLNVSAVRLGTNAEIHDVADNVMAAVSGTISVPAGQSLADLKDIVIASTQQIQFATSTNIVSEGDGSISVPIVLIGTAASQVNVPVTISGTATNGVDFSINTSLVIPDGSSSVNMVINLTDDAIAELPESIVVTLNAPLGIPVGAISRHTVFVLDNELPQLQVNDVSIAEGNSGSKSLNFTVTRLGDTLPALKFNYATQDVTATSPADYTGTTGSGFIDNGAISASFSIPIIGDTATEGNETFSVNLSNVLSVIGGTPDSGPLATANVGNSPQALAAADFNLDGLPDVVTADFSSSAFSILVGNTAPQASFATFATAQSFALSAAPGSVAVGDFNGDGKPDVVLTSRTPGAVLVRLNTTTPGSSSITFGAVQSFSAGTNPSAVTVADFNRDGQLDLAVANGGSNNVSLLLNTATTGATTMSFAAAQNFAAQNGPSAIVSGDLNGDGAIDLAVANATSNSVSVFFNTTTANSTTFGFTPATNLTVGSSPQAITIGDLNRDGLPDIVVANRGSNSIGWSRNNTTVGNTSPSFGAHQQTGVGIQAVGLAVVDLNYDGLPDIAVTGADSSSLLEYLNRTSPGATTLDLIAPLSTTVNTNPAGVVAADFDRDGRIDLATVSPASNNVAVVLNQLDQSAPPAPLTSVQSLSTQTPVGTLSVDLNGDGLPEVISTNDLPGTISIFRNTTTPGASSTTFSTNSDVSVGSRPLAIVSADINGDGRPDLAVTNYNSSSVSFLINTTVPGSTTFSFEPRQSVTVPASPTDLVFADVNGDGRPDLAVTSRSNNSVNVLINTTVPGDLTVGFGSLTSATTGLGPVAIVASDLNGDGLVDLAIANYTSGDISLLRNTTTPGESTANLAAVTNIASQVGVQALTVADINRDGRPDLAMVLRSANQLSTMLSTTPAGSTSLSFDPSQEVFAGNQPIAITAGDLDRDGIVDFVIANAGDGTLTRFFNRSGQASSTADFAQQSFVSVGGSPRDVALADLNLDGVVDILAANRSSNAVSAVIGRLATITDNVGIGTIVDDDTAPLVDFAIASQSVSEAAGTMTLVVQLSSVATSTVTIPFSVTGGSATGGGVDYSISSSPLTINAGASTAEITISLVNDLLDENDETIVITLGTPSGAVLGTTTQSTVTIVDDDGPTTVQFFVGAQSVAESGGVRNIFATLSAPSGVNVTVPFTVTGTATNTADYALSGGSFLFLAGQTSTFHTITIVNDTTFEADETVVLTFGSPTNAVLGSINQHTVTINDDDVAPTVDFVLASQSVNENVGTATVVVRLSAVSGVTTTIPFSVTGGSASGGGVDYSFSASPLTINAGASTATITVTVVDDTLTEANETLVFGLGSPAGATLGSTTQHTVTIVDNDFVPAVNFLSATQSANENAGSTTVVVQLSAVATSSVTIPFAIAGGSASGGGVDYSLSASPLTINAGASTGAITVTINDDLLVEGNETLILSFGTPTGATLGTTTQSTLTIIDNDVPPTVNFTAASQSVGENVGTTTVIARLSSVATSTVTIPFSVSGGSASGGGVDYTLSASPLTINAGASTAAITVTINDDAIAESNETLVLVFGTPTGATLGATTQHTVTIVDNDSIPALSFSAASQAVNENAGTTTVVVQLSAVAASTVTIPFSVSGGSASGGGVDYTLVASPLTINAGASTAAITVTINDDLLVEGNETIVLNLGTPTGATLSGTTQHTVTIIDNDVLPTVDFTVATQSVNENVGTTTVIARLSAVAASTVTIPFSVSGGSASGGGGDYTLSASPLTINAGASTAAITVTINDDLLVEGNETVVLNFGTPTGATLSGTTQHTVTIIDNDVLPTVDFTVATQSVNENVGTTTVIARLSAVAASTVTIPFNVSGSASGGGIDYSFAPSSLTINAGASTAAITLTINDDLLVEGNETIVLNFGTPTGATLGATTQHTVTIVDNDVLPTVDFSAATQSANENAGTATVVVRLSAVTPATVTIPFSLTGGSASGGGVDYSLSASPLTINAGASTATITVTINDDLIREGDETFTLSLGTPTGATLGATTQHTFTIVDNDPIPTVDFSSATQSINENSINNTVIVRLSSVAGSTVTIPFSVSGGTATGGSDYSLASSPVTINAGSSTAAITLTVNNDSLDENDETLVLTFGTPTGATLGATTQSTVTIVDDDAPPIVQFFVSLQSFAESASTQTILAVLSAPSTKAISVNYSVGGTANNPADYTLSGNTLTFAPGQTSAVQTITIVNDTTSESDETVVLTLGTPTNASLGGISQQTVTIVDDDQLPTASLTLLNNSLAENGGSATVVATLSFVPTQAVTVNLAFSGAATNGVDYSASAASILIAAGSTSGSVVLTSLDDVLLEGNEAIVIDIASVSGATENGTQQVTASIVDDASDPFQLNGNTLNIFGTSASDTIEVNYSASTTTFTAKVNSITSSFTATTININGLGGVDSLDLTLSTLVDQASLSGSAGTVTSANYSINIVNTENKVLRGGSNDSVDLNDTGSVVTAYLLPAYAIMQDDGGAYKNQPVGFGNYTANAAGNNDQLFIYGNSGNQAYTATPTKSTMPVGTQLLVGNNFQKSFAYGMGGTDTATYSGSSADETMTALSSHTFVRTSTTTQYFDRFGQLTVSGNGGNDTAVMYDSTGNDTFVASDGSYTFSGTTFRNIALGYDRCYAFQYFGGRDTATLNGGAGNDRLTVIASYSVLVTPSSLLQATGFSTVIVNAGTGNDIASFTDSTGNDTMVASGSTAELTFGNTKKVRAVGFDSVFATSSRGGVNRRTVTNPLTFTIRFTGPWV
jgi:hypothetical protein